MKVALVTPYSWTTPGGVNSQVAALGAALRKRGHEVRVLAPADGPVEPGVIRVGRTVPIPYNGSVARIAFGPRIAARVRNALRRADPDVVHAHEPFSPSASMLAVLVSPAPCVATFHASAPGSVALRAAAPVLRRIWRRLDGRIAVSAAARETVAAVFEDALTIVPNGIDAGRFGAVGPPDPSARTVVFLGRLERRKGAHVLLEAAPRLLSAVPDARIVVAGDGPERAALVRAVPERARDAVEFAGPVAPEDLAALAERASVLCFPSLGGESFGVVLLEAMAAGRPVVASAIPGYAAVLRGTEAGSLVAPGAPEALAAALAEILVDPGRARRMGEAGRAAAARYDWGRLVERVEAVYRDAVQAGAARRAR